MEVCDFDEGYLNGDICILCSQLFVCFFINTLRGITPQPITERIWLFQHFSIPMIGEQVGYWLSLYWNSLWGLNGKEVKFRYPGVIAFCGIATKEYALGSIPRLLALLACHDYL
jgi:hypothetical protein